MDEALTRNMVELARQIRERMGAFWTDQLKNADQLRVVISEIATVSTEEAKAMVQTCIKSDCLSSRFFSTVGALGLSSGTLRGNPNMSELRGSRSLGAVRVVCLLLASSAWAQTSDRPATQGLRVDQDVIHLIAVNRGADRAFDALAELAPAARRDPETGYLVDGLVPSDPAFGINVCPWSVEFLQEVNVSTSAYLPEYGRSSGALVQAVTRTGSNEFQGSVFANLTPGALEGTRKLIIDEGSVVSTTTTLKNLGDFGATLSGPVFKDRVWFFAGVVPTLDRYRHTRSINPFQRDPETSEISQAQVGPIPGANTTSFVDSRSFQYMGKLTSLIHPDHSVSLSITGTPFSKGGCGSCVETRASATAVGLKYAGAFMDKQILLDVNAGYFHQAASTQVGGSGEVGDIPGGVIGGLARAPVSPYQISGPGLVTKGILDRYQANAKATYVLNAVGTHVLKAGVDAELLSHGQRKSYSGGVFFPEGQLTGFIDSRQAAQESTTRVTTVGESTTVGGFLQDSWSIVDRVTVNAGLRYDVQSMYGRDGRRALKLGNQLSPRVGAIVDPLASGRMKFFVNFARYHEQVPLSMLDRAFPPERVLSAVGAGHHESRSNPDRLVSGLQVKSERVDPNLVPQSSDEYVAGGEYEVLANTRFGASYTHRGVGAVIEDMSRDGGNTYFLGNPGQGFATDFPKPVRNYDSVALYLNRVFADGWLAQVSYTGSRLYGNHPGPRWEGYPLEFDLVDLLPNRTGLLPLDRTHSVKLSGAKEFNITRALSTSIAMSYRGSSGTPINYYGAHPDYGQDLALVLQRGMGGRTPWVSTIDSNVGVNYRIGKDQVVSFTLDVFNLFNFQRATLVDETYTFESIYPLVDGKPGDLPGKVRLNTGDRAADEENPIYLSEDQVNPNFRRPAQYQAPRQVRLGILYTF
jgi:TonB dependent receptor